MCGSKNAIFMVIAYCVVFVATTIVVSQSGLPGSVCIGVHGMPPSVEDLAREFLLRLYLRERLEL
jgi:hypothetical protein